MEKYGFVGENYGKLWEQYGFMALFMENLQETYGFLPEHTRGILPGVGIDRDIMGETGAFHKWGIPKLAGCLRIQGKYPTKKKSAHCFGYPPKKGNHHVSVNLAISVSYHSYGGFLSHRASPQVIIHFQMEFSRSQKPSSDKGGTPSHMESPSHHHSEFIFLQDGGTCDGWNVGKNQALLNTYPCSSSISNDGMSQKKKKKQPASLGLPMTSWKPPYPFIVVIYIT